ncbi:stage II sporulation protein P [Radiobacillus sp. PE A8.2]|uniref:stage II sporulation protein P n=1 Tax=Radiobacillus sp. PE A8.2 TaxID=3380349 RepID=UPI00388D301F
MNKRPLMSILKYIKPLSKKLTILVAGITALFFVIGVITTIQPAYRLSSSTITNWTSKIDGASFLYLITMENRLFEQAYPADKETITLSNLAFEMATSLKPNDPRSLLGRELPGFDAYDREILVAGEGTDYTNLTMESTPPLDVVLEDRDVTVPDEPPAEEQPSDQEEENPDEDVQQTTGERQVVFVYNTHNRESFLPYFPEGTIPDEAFDSEVNITNVSDRLAKTLEEKGIGTQVDDTDIGAILREREWNYSSQSYQASKPVVEAALANNKDIAYVFDLHRDSMGRDVTTKTINGQVFARTMFVIGTENPNYEQNLQLATKLHELLEKKYPGLSRGVETYGGPGKNGVYNQDVSSNALLVEVGGVGNNLDELYRSADALADVFSSYYWDAEKVQGN